MAPTFDQIERDFVQLRSFILEDLERIVFMDTGGNFAAMALMLSACDIVGRLWFGKQRKPEVNVFAKCLPEQWRVVAESMYEALRNGLVHNYEARTVEIDGRQIGFRIAWRPRRHLTLDESRTWLVLAVPDLLDGLRRAFSEFEKELRGNPDLRDAFLKRLERIRASRVSPGPTEVASWGRLLAATKVVPD